MKNHQLILPFLMTAIVVGLTACDQSGSRKDSRPEVKVSESTNPAAQAPAPAPVAIAKSNATPPAVVEPVPATPPPAQTIVVEMPATPPVRPAKFYSDEPTLKPCCADSTNATHNYYLSFRAGYQHINYHDNRDTYYVGAKFYANGADLRARAGKNAWLVPDATAEISHQYLPKPDGSATPGTGEGMQFRADFFWPWLNWTTRVLAPTNNCPFYHPLAFSLGPVVEVGFDQLFDGSAARLARYAGARLTVNHDGFIEYTAGGTDGLSGTRQQVIAELPIYASRDGEVRYVLRGEWNRADEAQPDVLSGGLFLEMPFSIFAEPKKWSDLIPFYHK